MSVQRKTGLAKGRLLTFPSWDTSSGEGDLRFPLSCPPPQQHLHRAGAPRCGSCVPSGPGIHRHLSCSPPAMFWGPHQCGPGLGLCVLWSDSGVLPRPHWPYSLQARPPSMVLAPRKGLGVGGHILSWIPGVSRGQGLSKAGCRHCRAMRPTAPGLPHSPSQGDSGLSPRDSFTSNRRQGARRCSHLKHMPGSQS